jgi:chemosensory pili system protein ChpA (sensor histidine kinase/response regulator)
MAESYGNQALLGAAADTAPLAWVAQEIRASLQGVQEAVRQWRDAPAEMHALHTARRLLHETGGALHLLDLRGAALTLEAAEQALQRWEADAPAEHTQGSSAVEQALLAVAAYLERRLAGAADQPLRLFPYYRALRQITGAARIHPADLLHVDLTRRPTFDLQPVAPRSASELRRRRAAYERALLDFLRDASAPAARAALLQAVAALDQTPQRGLARTYWWVIEGLAEALVADALPVDDDLRRVLARTNLQLARLIDGSHSVAEQLFAEALFCVGRARGTSARVAAVHQLYDLPTQVPADFDAPLLTQVDPALVHDLKQALTAAKSEWLQVNTGGHDGTALTQALQRARQLAQQPAAQRLLPIFEALGKVVEVLPRLAPEARHVLGVEVASALLFAELGADSLAAVDAAYTERTRVLLARLQAAVNGTPMPPSDAWMLDLARRAADRLALTGVVGEMSSTLREIEQRLDHVFRNPQQVAEAAAALPLLDQVRGALEVLGHDEPAAVLRNLQGAVRGLAEGGAPPPDELARIAGNLGAIGFYVETLLHEGRRAADLFRYDPATDTFHANLGRAPLRAADGDGSATPATPPASAPDRSAEEEAALWLRRAQEAARRLATTPDDGAALDDLSGALARLALEAELIDDGVLQAAVTHANALWAQFERNGEPATVQALVEVLATRSNGTAVPAAAELPASAAAADLELLDTFIGEARELLADLPPQLAALRANPSERAPLITVRRSFHTLKGSSRMVGLTLFGEAAWSVEQCFNLWLAQERATSADLLDLATTAAGLMDGWLITVQADPAAALPIEALVAAAERVREGAPYAPLWPAAAAIVDTPASAVEAPDAAAALTAPPSAEPTAAPTAGWAGSGSAESRRIGPIEISHALFNVFVNESDEHARALVQEIGEWRYEPARVPAASALRAAHSLNGIAGTVGLAAVAALAEPIEAVLRELSPLQPWLASAVRPQMTLDAPQFDVLERAIERLRGMLHQFAAGQYPADAPLEAAAVRDLVAIVRAQVELAVPVPLAAADVPALLADAPALLADAPALPAEDVGGAAPAETAPEETPAAAVDMAPAETAMLPSTAEAPALAEPLAEPLIELLTEPPAEPLADAVPAPAAESSSGDGGLSLRDDLDAELLAAFAVEAQELLPAAAAQLRALADDPTQPEPARELMRQLHTLKGAARMAGAMRLGEAAHRVETRLEEAQQAPPISRAVVEELQNQFDAALALFDNLQHPVSGARAAALPSSTVAVPGFGSAAAGGAYVRVRGDVLDRLVDQTGEVSIARSKLENEVTTLKSSLTDLTDNIQRLRSQLREVEIQAEAQIQARSDRVARAAADFDPLEFDRYTRLQELTRLLAESVEDVAMIQGNMIKGLSSADVDLTAQSRLTRELQQQLMRVRLVPFASLAERLYRVARQTAKEVGKRVNLDLRGGATEIDRGVLEKMAGPFEHLVRNAIVHGIEVPALRRAAGKSEIGELAVEVRQQGNEVVVSFTDDGAGLDFERIRARAVAQGLLDAAKPAGERELAELIFAPGFTTAEAVSELAGRGVGMDVVRAEAAALGGRVTLNAEAGRGLRVALYVPLTLAVTQAVLATVGERRYAIPAAMVEQVRRYKPNVLAPLLAQGSLTVPPLGDIALRPLAQLVDSDASFHHARQIPVLLLNTGEARLAVAADDVTSGQEVVVKNVGAQMSRLVGLLGATILGNGEVVLIINPVQLLTRAPQLAVPVIKTAATPLALPAAPLILVVDDSLTVRRVTQRLLERNGYEVMLAKDGVDALRQLQDRVPDAILLDIEMPRMDGFDCARNVRADPSTRGIPIVMITSRSADKHRKMALEVGADHFLGKPFAEDELLALLAGYSGRKVV